LLPIENSCPTPELLDAIRAYHAATRKRVTLAWVLMAGVNTRDEDARQLAALTHGLPIRLDLIDVNRPIFRAIRERELNRPAGYSAMMTDRAAVAPDAEFRVLFGP
jgi:23S rRNA (adenine2503-C2)-methyltransferase